MGFNHGLTSCRHQVTEIKDFEKKCQICKIWHQGPGRTYSILFSSALVYTFLLTFSIFKTSPSSVTQPLQIFPTPASHFHPCVTPPQGGSDQMRPSPPVRSSASARQRHHHPPVASRVLKRFLPGVIEMSPFLHNKVTFKGTICRRRFIFLMI